MSHCDTHVKSEMMLDGATLDETSTFYERVMSFMRDDEGETREEFAERLGVKVDTLNRWSQGARPTQPWRYVALAERLGCNAAWLYAGRTSRKPEKVGQTQTEKVESSEKVEKAETKEE